MSLDDSDRELFDQHQAGNVISVLIVFAEDNNATVTPAPYTSLSQPIVSEDEDAMQMSLPHSLMTHNSLLTRPQPIFSPGSCGPPDTNFLSREAEEGSGVPFGPSWPEHSSESTSEILVDPNDWMYGGKEHSFLTDGLFMFGAEGIYPNHSEASIDVTQPSFPSVTGSLGVIKASTARQKKEHP